MCGQWKNYIIKATLLFLSLVVADRSVGYVLQWMYFNQKGEDYFYTTKALDKQTADLIVLGSSRARNHYNPEILEDSLGISCYNAGRSGCFFSISTGTTGPNIRQIYTKNHHTGGDSV